MTQVITGKATPTDSGSYRLLPFEVPPNAVRLSVQYAFGEEIEAGSGIIDIGVFDARGADFMDEGFRGWSGSARRTFTITPTEATPGYVPGPLLPGTWQVCLGLYQIDPHGCDYRVTIDIEIGETVERTFPTLLSLSDQPRPERRNPTGWYKGELHCHTHHSDGDSAPEVLIALAESLGLDFLAITDHNVLTQQMVMRESRSPLMLIPGVEVTTYRGHWNAWGETGWLDFRVTTPDEMRRVVDSAMARGALVSCNHPRPYGPPWEYTDIESFDCVEVWNGPWPFLNEVCLNVWEGHLRAGRRYTAVGGSDTHFLDREHPAKLGHPTTYIYCPGDPSPAGLLAGLRAGHAFVTESPTGPQLYLTAEAAMAGDTLQPEGHTLTCRVQVIDGTGSSLELHGAQGIIATHPIDSPEWSDALTLDTEGSPYIRAQLVQLIDGSPQVRALTNPIYLTYA